MQNKTLDKRIAKLKDILLQINTTNPYLLEKEDIELHSLIHSYHSFFEQVLDKRFAKSFTKSLPLRPQKQIALEQVFYRVFANIDFAKKIKLVHEFGLLSDDLKKALYKFNQIRVVIAHPAAFEETITSYREKQKHLEILTLTKDILQMIMEEIP